MATFSKLTLSASTDGRGIPVVATSGTGTTIHTASSTSTVFDEIWLYAINTDTTARKLTTQWGGTATGDEIEITIPAESGLVLIAPGLLLKGNATPLLVRAFCPTASVINIHGYVNRIS